MSKEHAYAYEAGYRDGSVHYELEHCPACKNVADLQEALKENAKLRELVEDMAADIRGLGVDFKRVGWCDYADRMRELGVEV